MSTTKEKMSEMQTKLAKLNLDNFVKNGQGRKSIYKLPAEIANDEKKLKKFRKEIRREKTKICLSIVKEFKEKNSLSKSTIDEFKKFYADKFLVNDYSLNSFTSVTETKEESKLYEVALFLVKENVSK